MPSFRSFLAVASLWVAIPSAAKEPAYYDSLRLVSAMREDERMLRIVREEKSQRAKLSQPQRQCLDGLEYFEITELIARQIGYNMTSAEVREAIGYFQSPGGRKQVRRELGMPGETQFTATDQAELDQFKQRPAGRKLLRDLILKDDALRAAVAERIQRRLEDCAFLQQTEREREIPESSCQAQPVASQDNVCLATYAAEGAGRKPQRASVEVNCRHDGRVLTSRIALAKPEAPVALRWSDNRELEILVDGKVKSSSPSASSGPKVSFATWQKSDPPLLSCATKLRGPPTLANSLPPGVAVGSWRTYGRRGLCVMTSRVPKEELPGANGDVLLQFRRQKPAVAPFATTDLALVVAIDQQSGQPLLVSFGQRRFSLIAQPPQQTHILAGTGAEILLDNLRARPIELTVRGEGGKGYSIPLRGADFDVAYVELNECLATLPAN